MAIGVHDLVCWWMYNDTRGCFTFKSVAILEWSGLNLFWSHPVFSSSCLLLLVLGTLPLSVLKSSFHKYIYLDLVSSSFWDLPFHSIYEITGKTNLEGENNDHTLIFHLFIWQYFIIPIITPILQIRTLELI